MTAVEKIKAKILDLAIRGKLVPQDPNDEPASVLLERIKAEKAKLVKAKKIKKKNPSEIIVGADGATYEKFADGTTKDISDELPFDLPQGWAWARIRELGTFVGGHTPSIADTTNWENGTVLWVTSKDMKQKYIDTTGIKLSRKGAAELHLLPTGSLIMVTRSGILRRTFPIALAAKPLTINQDQRALEFYDNAIGEYIYYCVKSLEPIILRDYRKTGTTVESIIWDRFVEMPLPIPPIEEQTRIVSMVEELFGYAKKINEATDGIEKTAARIDKKILVLAIRGKLVPQDPNDEPASELVRRIEATRTVKASGKKSRAAASDRPAYEIDPPFDIPDSWEWVKLKSLCEVISKGTTPKGGSKSYSPNGVTYIRAENVTADGQLKMENCKYIREQVHCGELSRSILNEGDLLITIAGSLGRSAIVNTDALPANTNQAVAFARPVDVRLSPFLLIAIQSTVVQALLLAQKKVTGIPNLTLETISNLTIPLPPLAEQKRIVTKIKELRAMTKSLTT